MNSTASTPARPLLPASADPLDALARRSVRLANAVEAISRRRPVRERRAKLLLLILELSCPLGARQRRKRWYVPGATARVGAEGLRRAWRGFYGEEPPTLRTVRTSLGELERCLAIVRAPGDWLPIRPDPDHPERRPRYPDTWHVLEDDEAATWWERVGFPTLAKTPAARHNPDGWRRLFSGWRARAARLAVEPLLPFPEPPTAAEAAASPQGAAPARTSEEPRRPASAYQRRQGAALRRLALRADLRPLDLLAELRDLGVRLNGMRASLELVGAPGRLRGAVALLAKATARGDRIRNPAGWLLRAFRNAPELASMGARP